MKLPRYRPCLEALEDRLVLSALGAPTDIVLSNQTVTAGQPALTAIGTFSTVDPDPAEPFIYSLSGPNSSLFTVDNTTATLKTNAIFLNAVQQFYQLDVQSTDTLGVALTETFTITVNPSTTPPTDISLSAQSVSAGRPLGTIVGFFATTDPNAGQSFIYTLLGSDAGWFTVDNATGALKTNTIFQNNIVQTAQFQVHSTDTLGLSFNKTFTITIYPSATPPTNISLSSTAATAYRPVGTAIGALNTSDPNAGQSFAYTLNGDSAGLFQVDNAGMLRTNTVFQNSSVATYQLQIQSTDTLGLSYSKTFTITVNPSVNLPHLTVTGSNQASEVGQGYGNYLTATVTDPSGQALSGVIVTFQTPATGAGGTLNGGSTGITDNNGTVSKILTANAVTGTFDIGVQIGGGLVSATISGLTNLAGTAARLAFVKGPSTVLSNLTMAPVLVQLQDQNGNPVAQSGVTVHLFLGATRIKGTLSRPTNSKGIAVFYDLSVIRPGTYTLIAKSTNLGAAVSQPFTVKVNPFLLRKIYHP